LKNDFYKQPVIYVVDDDEDDLFFIKSSVSNNISGSTVKCFTNGKQLIDNLVKTKELPAFIIMDLNMPIFNGKETIQYLKKHNMIGNTPVIIFSTSNNPQEKKLCIQYGASAYYCKPSSVQVYDEIIQTLRKQYLGQVAMG
jgi:CheY-like chemotaxis protein